MRAYVFDLIFMIALASWACTLVFLISMVRNRKPEARHDPRLRWNPFIVIYHASLLTEKGLRFRRWLIYALLIFVGSIVVAALFSVTNRL